MILEYTKSEKNENFSFFTYKKQEREKLTEADYVQAAVLLSEQATQFKLFIDKASGHTIDTMFDTMYPFLSNCALACELMLKALLCYEKCDYIRKIEKKQELHSLLHLFNLLDEKTKTEIMTHDFFVKCRNEDFTEDLKEYSKAFVKLRYANEYKKICADPFFLPNLMVILYKILQNHEKENKTYTNWNIK